VADHPPSLEQLIAEGILIPPEQPGGVGALLAIEPLPAVGDWDSAEVVSELREDRL
jgi:hypothetical protein